MKFLVTGGSGFIGTNLIAYLLSEFPSASILNLDIAPPRNSSQTPFHSFCDINDLLGLTSAFVDFCPTHVFHLAATTGIGDLPLDFFDANIQGVQNVIKVSAQCTSLQRIVFASSLLVCRVGYVPQSFDEYCPSTSYGISKMKGELLVKNAPSHLPWVIVRPISIWGPWNSEPYTQFFQAVLTGAYFHIGQNRSLRSLGYVGNAVFQLTQLAFSESSLVNHKLFYLADYEASSLRDMASKIATFRSSKDFIPIIPFFIAKLLALFGDLYQFLFRRKFPLTSFRLHNLSTEYVFDLSDLKSVCGRCPFSFDYGLITTIKWLRHKDLNN